MSGASERRASDMAIRVIAGIAMIGIALIAIRAGGVIFWMLASVVALFMMAEWSDLTGADARTKRIAQFGLCVPLATMAPPSLLLVVHDFFTLGLLAGAAFFVVIITRKPHVAAGVIYCGLPALALIVIRRQQGAGVVFLLWAMALVWACDIGAYFAGRTIGGPKLAPSISPAKTWAGLAGGVVLASLFAAAMHIAYGLPLRLTIATPALAVLAQGGDLFESWMKRRAGVKDSGTILPGHGGVLDRMDGVVPVAPVAAFLVVLPTLIARLT